MKYYLPILILMLLTGFTTTGRADTHMPADADSAGQAEAGSGDHGDTRSRSAFSELIRARVIDTVNEALEDDPEISAEERERIIGKLRDPRRFGDWDNWGADENLGAGKTLVATLSILLIFGSPIMLVIVILYAGYRKRQIASETAGQFLASGQSVPPEVWRGLVGDASPRSNLHKGMIMLGTGLGIFLCFWLIGSIEAAYLGLIPLFIGFAQLLIWKLEKPRTDSRDNTGA